jgi:Spy/CpxP family protein refolding chaperone
VKHKSLGISILLFCGIAIPISTQAHPPWLTGGQGQGTNMDCTTMGPGMMMGPGMGCGKMGMHHMMGGLGMMRMPGMMMGGYGMLNLSDKQIEQFNDIQTKLEKDHWKLMGKMIDQKSKLREVWSADKPDPKKVGDAYEEIFQIRRQAIEARVSAMNKMYDALTDEQREQLKSGPRGMGGGPMGRRGHMMMQ